MSVKLLKHDGPLTGKRVVITRSSLTAPGLDERLTAAGAITIRAPMIRVDHPLEHEALDAAIRKLGRYAWIVFTSVHGVRGFFNRLTTLGQDARASMSCKAAAIGPITAGALRKRGVTPELVPEPYSATALVDRMLVEIAGRPSRVLCIRGNLTASELPDRLRSDGVAVDEVVAYCIATLTPHESVLRAVRNGVNAVLFCSPAAARRFAALRLEVAGAVVACIGPSTAAAACGSGMHVDLVARPSTDERLVAALARYFHRPRVCCARADTL